MITLRFFTLGNKKTANTSDEANDTEKLIAIIEVVVLVFITTFIPALIRLGRPPQSIEEIWVELLVALLASAYAYARIRGITLDPQ